MDDPAGFTRELQSELRMADTTIDSWLYAGADQFGADPQLERALLAIAEVPDSRGALLLLGEILRTPGLAERLTEVLQPSAQSRRAIAKLVSTAKFRAKFKATGCRFSR